MIKYIPTQVLRLNRLHRTITLFNTPVYTQTNLKQSKFLYEEVSLNISK